MRSIAQYGAAVLAAGVFSLATGAETVRVGGTGSALGTMRLLAEGFHATGTATRVTILPALGSGGGIKAMFAGATEIALISTPLTPDAAARGAVAVEYARTPLVFATWPGGAVDGLTRGELADLYDGKRVRWTDTVPVRLVLRPAADVDTRLIAGLSPALGAALTAAGKRPGMIVADTDTEAADLIERTEGALGATTLAQILSERRRAKVLKLDGVTPSAGSLTDGRYPMQKRLSMVTGPQPSAGAREFMAFVASRAGRAILERTGHVAVTLP